MGKRLLAALLCALLLLPIFAGAEPAAEFTLTVSAGTAKPGETAEVTLEIANNPGIAGARFSVAYDQALTLSAVENGEAFSALVFTKPGSLTDNPINLLWDGMDADATNGVAAKLTFTVKEDASAAYYPITVTYQPSNVYDADLENVPVKIVNGSIVGDAEPQAHTHSYTDEVTTEPTCTQAGERTYRCICGDSYSEPIDALQHDYVPEITAPTPFAGGYTTYTCSRCKDSYTAEETAPLQLTAIAISEMPEKTRYTAGETFDPSGMAVTAIYENDVTVPVADYTYSGGVLAAEMTEVVISYGGKTVSVPITVAEPTAAPERTITVTFSLLGDSKHGEEAVHTLKNGGLQTWIAPMQVTLPAGATAIDLISKALGMKGIAFQNPDGNYITEIRGIGQLDNGNLSGWMYTRNGRHSQYGVAEQALANGDVIVMHYTDDYTQEEGSERFSPAQPSVSQKDAEAKTDNADSADNSATGRTYSDVAETAWYDAAVEFVTEKGMMNGTAAKTFSPEATMTRAMLMTVLARYAGENTEGGATWYEKGMNWAMQKGVSDGTNPNGNITREQLVTMLYRYAGSPEATGELKFADADTVSSYAEASMRWAVANGIVKGMSETTLAPQATATRAQVAAMLQRFVNLMAKKA